MARRTTIGLLSVCIIGVALFAPGLWSHDVWHPLEPMYAQIAHEIVASGNWLTLRCNGEPYYNKPPVFFWLEAISIKAFGLRTISVRLPSFVLGVGSLVLCYFIARRLSINPVMSSLILATSWGFARAAQRTTLDGTLTFLLLLAFYLYLVSDEAKRCGWAYSIGALFAACVAVMVKGPVALLFLACAIFPFLIWRRQWRRVLHWKWLVAILVIGGVAGTWLVALSRLEGDQFIKTLLGREVASRLGGSWERAKPIYHYVIAFPRDFLPWSIFFPMAAAYAWKRRDEKAFQLLLSFATVFVILTLVPARSNRYIIPLYPVAAMIVAAYFSADEGRAWRVKWFKALVGVTAVGILVYSLTYYPDRNPRKSPKPLAMFLKARGATAEDILWYRGYEEGVAFYAGFPHMRVAGDVDSLEQHPHKWLIVRDEHVQDLVDASEPVRRFRIGRKRYQVFRTDQPPGEETP